MEPTLEAQLTDAQINIRDVALHELGLLVKIGSQLKGSEQHRLGVALGRHFKDYRLGAKHLVASQIQSFMRTPIIQNVVERTSSPLDIAYSIRPTGRSEGQIKAMRRRINEFNDPGGRGVAQLRTRFGARIDRGR